MQLSTRLRWQGGVTAGVLVAAIGVAVASGPTSGVPQASGRVLALIQRAPLALSSYPSIAETLTITASGRGTSAVVTADGAATPDGKAATFSYHLPGGLPSFRMQIVDGVVYVAVPESSRSHTAGRAWASLTLTGVNNPQLNPGDANQLLRLLAGANGSVDDIGPQRIGGVDTEHYHLLIDTQAAYDRIPEQFRPPRSALAALGARIPYDVWLDPQGVPRQMASTTSTQGITVTLAIGIRPSSRVLHVVAPPSRDVYQVYDGHEIGAILAGQ